MTEDILNPNIKIDNKNILIFHTHSCESYTPSEKYQYSQTGNYRTTDKLMFYDRFVFFHGYGTFLFARSEVMTFK